MLRHGSTQQLCEEQQDNTTQLLLVPLLDGYPSIHTKLCSFKVGCPIYQTNWWLAVGRLGCWVHNCWVVQQFTQLWIKYFNYCHYLFRISKIKNKTFEAEMILNFSCLIFIIKKLIPNSCLRLNFWNDGCWLLGTQQPTNSVSCVVLGPLVEPVFALE